MNKYHNYLSIGTADLVRETSGYIELWRGRMFEYTPIDVERSLKSLEPEVLEYLKSLPTLFCSEMQYDVSGVSIYVKLIKITKIEASSKTVSINFSTVLDLGLIHFETVDELHAKLGLGKLQAYRTHWAVLEGDFTQILDNLRVIKSGDAEFVSEFPTTDEEQEEMPSYEKTVLGTVDSISSFLEILQRQPKDDKKEVFFRGHSDEKYQLTPSVLRKNDNGVPIYLDNEERLCKELLIAHYEEFQSDQFCFDRLVRMQHYKLPTRLLDITSNPLMALFFSCDGQTDKMDIPGEVIIFRVSRDNLRYFDSDTVSCIANLSKMSIAEKDDLELSMELKEFNKTPVAGQLLHHVKSEKSYFEDRINPRHLSSVFCVKAKHTNARIKSQSGAFLLFGHQVSLPEYGQDGIEISRVKVVNKRKILSELESINISKTTVYPSIDETANFLAERYKLLED
jgi:hypothetical protein